MAHGLPLSDLQMSHIHHTFPLNFPSIPVQSLNVRIHIQAQDRHRAAARRQMALAARFARALREGGADAAAAGGGAGGGLGDEAAAAAAGARHLVVLREVAVEGGLGDEWLVALRLAEELRAEGLDIADIVRAPPAPPHLQGPLAADEDGVMDRVVEVVEQWWVALLI